MLLLQVIQATEEWELGFWEDLGIDDPRCMQHLRDVRKHVQTLLTASQKQHPAAWIEFGVKVHQTPTHVRSRRTHFGPPPVLVRTTHKRPNDDGEEWRTSKRMRLDEADCSTHQERSKNEESGITGMELDINAGYFKGENLEDEEDEKWELAL